MSATLKDLKQNAAINGNKITERDREALRKFMSNGDTDTKDCVDLFSEPMQCFIFEAVIRPADNGLVLHLKNLAPALRNAKFFDYARIFITDRIGKYGKLEVSFIGEVDAVNKLNSLDFMFEQYYPALRGDMAFIKRHAAKIGKELDDYLVREIGEYARTLNNTNIRK